MAEEPIRYDIDHRGVATVTLNRPRMHNAYVGALLAGFREKRKPRRYPEG